jgi:hypothetical protein
MKKFLIIAGITIVIGLIALAFWLANGNKTSTTSSENIGFPVANSVAQKTTIATTTNATTPTKDFLKDPATVKDPINPGYYYLGYHVNEGVPDPTATNTPPYIIEYISATQYFNIALLQEPIGTVRKEAEQFLMADLGISQKQMCQLNYMVSVPDNVNSQYSGINLGFSFCPGATELPQ